MAEVSEERSWGSTGYNVKYYRMSAFWGCQRNFRDIWWLSSDYYKTQPTVDQAFTACGICESRRDPKDFFNVGPLNSLLMVSPRRRGLQSPKSEVHGRRS